MHAHIPINPSMGYPRPINRIPPPQFLTSYTTMEENWQMTDELMAEIERADLAQALSQQPAVPGMSGVAYAGGAASGAVYVRETSSPLKDPAVDRVRVSDRSSPKDVDSGQVSGGSSGRRGVRTDRERDVQYGGESIRPHNRPLPASQANSPTFSQQGQPSAQGNTSDRTSPMYHTAVGSSGGENTAADYISYKRDSYQSSTGSHARLPTPPQQRKVSSVSSADNLRTTPPAASKLASQTPPLQAMKTRTPDKSLPVQEEPEDDIAALKNDNSHIQQYDRLDSRTGHRDDDDDTLIENESEDNLDLNGDRDGEPESYTPRSPTVGLPDAYQNRQYNGQSANSRLASLTKHHRNGSTDQLGLRSFDTAVFQKRPVEENRESPPPPTRSADSEQSHRSAPEHPLRHQQSQSHQYDSREQYTNMHPLRQQIVPSDDQHSVDDPASAYVQAYFQSPRPGAPIPPTPHSQTAAPSPLISSMHASPAPPVGSPYPFPFSHVRRSNTYSGYPTQPAPSSNYDPNHPSVIEEQLALQMQMYALNNHAAMSDSTFSPSTTPFPGPGYNPWAFLQASRAFGGRRLDSTMSLQSSPSHQPVSLPFPTSRGRGLKRRERSTNLRVQGATRQKVKPPPRVDSTQPRETSPEPDSSGEETAGEDRYEVTEEGAWMNGTQDDGGGEWVDEDDADKEDLLDLEYHPNYISNIERRRRKWDSRWDALEQAFRALDCETDTTMVLLAAPSHSTKLHALTSRSIRRDLAFRSSPAMASIRNSFRTIAARRRAARSQGHGSSLVDRLMLNSSGSGDGSDGSSESREEDLKRALETALGSLGALRSIYDHRVARWEDEMSRINDERESVQMLLHQILGSSMQNGNGVGRAM
ncbi:hypothetical protein BV22DRAFT_1016446 [Leucogyrophana mollusca]|uniref:Uncharacterized protein n=1 Tax=Leucogyrophana mollusca TaxID=85980 RepID=A0ACB8BDJ3_9AGAM|nr:hypothetical protein BV22DRAFT_1016446 [Leucogyrophana mollusca]